MAPVRRVIVGLHRAAFTHAHSESRSGSRADAKQADECETGPRVSSSSHCRRDVIVIERRHRPMNDADAAARRRAARCILGRRDVTV